ncbi:MAG TPA: YidC/Oxa1 family insertase periplasmic-domain containing protein [Gemmatimonadaceae bacterium]|nr:YidC/Oxa1 family insertase periplasmic-domain containing protein [Gemmatimonadaceae bacterium]
MNRRFFLALLLTGIVVFGTPLLFQGPRRPPITNERGDSARAVERDSAGRGDVRPAATPPGVSAAKPAPGSTAAAGAPPTAASGTPARVTAPAETSVVNTPKARLRVSSAGASLIGAAFNDYRRLGGDSTRVEIARSGDPLLSFRLVAAGDTLALDRTTFAVEHQADPNVLLFRGTVRDIPVTVKWSFVPDTYRVTISRVQQPVGYVAQLDVTAGVSGNAYLLVDLPSGFQSSEADSISDFTHLAYAFHKKGGGADLVRFSKLNPGERAVKPGPLTWTVAKSKYFLVGLLSDAGIAELQVSGAPRTSRIATSGHATAVVPLRDGRASLEAYVGPQDWRRLVAMGRDFENANPYGGWMQGLVQPFATIVMRLLLWMKDLFKLNYGVTLIIFGIAIRVILWPLNQTAMRSSLRMQRIQPELAAVQKKYASNPEKQRDEIMRIYREHGMSPFSALSGCLPMLIPMPVLFALFFVFQNTIEFRGVSFWWVPDISQFDPLYILPIAMAGSMFVLSWLGQRNAPPNPQAKMMMYMLPVMMGFFFFRFAAGLNLYYASQNLAAIPQQWLIANERAKAGPKTG